MKIYKPLVLFSIGLMLMGCSNKKDIESVEENQSVEETIFSEEDTIVSIDAAYGENDEIIFGDEIDESLLSLNIHYKNKTETLTSKDFDIDVGDFDAFSDKDVEIQLTSKDDQTITAKTTLKKKVRQNLKLLFIGNSFSEDTIQWMYEISDSLNINLKVENMNIGGCNIRTHFDNIDNDNKVYTRNYRAGNSWASEYNVGLREEIASDDWDFISLQQVSDLAGVVDSYQFLPHLINEIGWYIKDTNHTRIVWNMTWAYQSDCTHSGFARYGNDQMKMYKAILAAVEEEVLTNQRIATLIPNGTAIQNARTSFLGDTLTRDGYHMSYDIGRYIVGLMAIKALTGANIDDCTYSPTDEKTTTVCKESVNNAFKNKYQITDSIYTE